MLDEFLPFIVHMLTSFTIVCTKLVVSDCLRVWWKYMMSSIISAGNATELHVLSCSWNSALCLTSSSPMIWGKICWKCEYSRHVILSAEVVALTDRILHCCTHFMGSSSAANGCDAKLWSLKVALNCCLGFYYRYSSMIIGDILIFIILDLSFIKGWNQAALYYLVWFLSESKCFSLSMVLGIKYHICYCFRHICLISSVALIIHLQWVVFIRPYLLLPGFATWRAWLCLVSCDILPLDILKTSQILEACNGERQRFTLNIEQRNYFGVALPW